MADTRVATQLKPDAIGFVDALVIGLAATSPAYSLAAVIGPIAALVGIHAPGAARCSAMLGSTPHKLLHLSSRPVLCVPIDG